MLESKFQLGRGKQFAIGKYPTGTFTVYGGC